RRAFLCREVHRTTAVRYVIAIRLCCRYVKQQFSGSWCEYSPDSGGLSQRDLSRLTPGDRHRHGLATHPARLTTIGFLKCADPAFGSISPSPGEFGFWWPRPRPSARGKG